MSKLKLMTIVGTRPEIIRLAAVIKKCDKYFDQILVHTGQNYDYNLNQIFFEDLGLTTLTSPTPFKREHAFFIWDIKLSSEIVNIIEAISTNLYIY